MRKDPLSTLNSLENYILPLTLQVKWDQPDSFSNPVCLQSQESLKVKKGRESLLVRRRLSAESARGVETAGAEGTKASLQTL